MIIIAFSEMNSSVITICSEAVSDFSGLVAIKYAKKSNELIETIRDWIVPLS